MSPDPLSPALPPATTASRVPDVDIETEDSLLQFWMRYRTPLITSILVLLAISVLVTWYFRNREQQEQQAVERLNAASSLYQNMVLNTEATVEEAEQTLAQAIQLADTVRAEYPGFPAAHHALFIKGNCQYERAYHQIATGEGQRALDLLDEAITAFTTYIDEPADDQDHSKGLIALAACFENRAFFSDDDQLMQSAIARLTEAARLGQGTYLEAQALVNQARCYESLGQRDQARELYVRIQQLRPSVAQTAGSGVLGLSSQAGFSELAAQRLERIQAGIDQPDSAGAEGS